MFTIGPVPAWDTIEGVSVARPKLTAKRRVILICPGEEVYINIRWGALGTPGGPYIESEDFSRTTYLNYCKRKHKLKFINFPLLGVNCPFINDYIIIRL